MKKDGLIEWNASLLTGVPTIDEQHQILVAMLNDATTKLEHRSGRDQLEAIVRDLMSYALYHFDTEEELIFESDYDEQSRNAHFDEHRMFSETVAKFQQDMAAGRMVAPDELMGFLRDWIVHHILHVDQQFGRFVAGSASTAVQS